GDPRDDEGRLAIQAIRYREAFAEGHAQQICLCTSAETVQQRMGRQVSKARTMDAIPGVHLSRGANGWAIPCSVLQTGAQSGGTRISSQLRSDRHRIPSRFDSRAPGNAEAQ